MVYIFTSIPLTTKKKESKVKVGRSHNWLGFACHACCKLKDGGQVYSSVTSCLQAKEGPVSPGSVQTADLQLGQLPLLLLPLFSRQRSSRRIFIWVVWDESLYAPLRPLARKMQRFPLRPSFPFQNRQSKTKQTSRSALGWCDPGCQ